MGFVYPLIALGSLGILFGIGLFVASRVFHVKVDSRIDLVVDALPGANCGGCGLPGCGGLAEAIVHGSAEVDACPVCSSDELGKIAAIMGVTAEAGARKVAIVRCQGRKVQDAFDYNGPETCGAATLLLSGHKACTHGCLGFADCVRACPFNALSMSDGIPTVDEERCTACGKCVEACPRNLIELLGVDKFVHVFCRSHDKGGTVRKVCEVGCIGCKKCEKICKFDAIHVTNFLAEIDFDKCVSCAACVKECPSGTILNLRKARRARAKKEAS